MLILGGSSLTLLANGMGEPLCQDPPTDYHTSGQRIGAPAHRRWRDIEERTERLRPAPGLRSAPDQARGHHTDGGWCPSLISQPCSRINQSFGRSAQDQRRALMVGERHDGDDRDCVQYRACAVAGLLHQVRRAAGRVSDGFAHFAFVGRRASAGGEIRENLAPALTMT